jgi:hypothetical protein
MLLLTRDSFLPLECWKVTVFVFNFEALEVLVYLISFILKI